MHIIENGDLVVRREGSVASQTPLSPGIVCGQWHNERTGAVGYVVSCLLDPGLMLTLEAKDTERLVPAVEARKFLSKMAGNYDREFMAVVDVLRKQGAG